jgi:hypothetical protein
LLTGTLRGRPEEPVEAGDAPGDHRQGAFPMNRLLDPIRNLSSTAQGLVVTGALAVIAFALALLLQYS